MMRVVLAGRAADRARVRTGLTAAGLTIVREDEVPPDEVPADVDAIVLAGPRSTARVGADGSPLAPLATDDDVIVEALTRREREVLALMADGLTNKNIAAALGISDQTVKFHAATITAKLGARNRTDAVRRAVRHGLVTI